MENTILYHVLEETSLTNGKLYRIKKGAKLRLTCHPTLLDKNIKVFCNLPKNLKDNLNEFKFKRDKFYEYSWIKNNENQNNDDFDKYIEIEFLIAGSFQYYFLIEKDDTGFDIEHPNGGSDILIEPELKFSNGKIVDLNCLQMQTVLPKLLGSLDEWESRLRVTKECGYNVIHFAPIEELSRQSHSSYSLRNHRKLNEIASSNDKFNFKDLEKLLKKIYNEWDMFSICDLVYNHMSNDAPFLHECPDAGYNLENSKFLRPAFLFDRLLYYLSKDIENGKYDSMGIKSDELTFGNLEQIRDLLVNDLVPKVRFEEFYCLNIENILNEIREKILINLDKASETVEPNLVLDLWAKLFIIQDSSYGRFKNTVDFNIVRKIVEIEYNQVDRDEEYDDETIIEKFKSHFEFLNAVKKTEVYSWLDCGVQNVFLNGKYHFFADDGPKFKRITKETPLITLYFFYPFDDSTLQQDEIDAFDPNSAKAKYIMAHNG
jgi:glycogen debranching enzyme